MRSIRVCVQFLPVVSQSLPVSVRSKGVTVSQSCFANDFWQAKRNKKSWSRLTTDEVSLKLHILCISAILLAGVRCDAKNREVFAGK
jgi:hypothetical protein